MRGKLERLLLNKSVLVHGDGEDVGLIPRCKDFTGKIVRISHAIGTAKSENIFQIQFDDSSGFGIQVEQIKDAEVIGKSHSLAPFKRTITLLEEPL